MVSTSQAILHARIIAIFVVAGCSAVGCCLPLVVGEKPGKGGGRGSGKDDGHDDHHHDGMTLIHRLLKCMAAGVIVSIGFIHIMGDAAERLGAVTEYPLAFVVTMIGSFLTLALNQVMLHSTSVFKDSQIG